MLVIFANWMPDFPACVCACVCGVCVCVCVCLVPLVFLWPILAWHNIGVQLSNLFYDPLSTSTDSLASTLEVKAIIPNHTSYSVQIWYTDSSVHVTACDLDLCHCRCNIIPNKAILFFSFFFVFRNMDKKHQRIQSGKMDNILLDFFMEQNWFLTNRTH